jgi:hypothetical protein
MYDILKVSGLVFEMVNGLEMYIIYCVALAAAIIFCLWLWTPCRSTFKTLNKSKLNKSESICNTEISNILPLLSCLNLSNVSQFSGFHLLPRRNHLGVPELVAILACCIRNSGILKSLLRSDEQLIESCGLSPSVKTQVWHSGMLDQFTGSRLFCHLERMSPSARDAEIHSLKPGNTPNSLCYAGRYPLAIPRSQRKNGPLSPHTIFRYCFLPIFRRFDSYIRRLKFLYLSEYSNSSRVPGCISAELAVERLLCASSTRRTQVAKIACANATKRRQSRHDGSCFLLHKLFAMLLAFRSFVTIVVLINHQDRRAYQSLWRH